MTAVEAEGARRGYWYGSEDPVTAMLAALRSFRVADQDLRRRLSVDMGMNVTDLQAVQHVVAAERSGRALSARDLSDHLHISTASTTKLLDRLVASGHVLRRPHPRDRRSVVVVATDHAHRQIRERLTRMHGRLREIAEQVPPHAREAVTVFLQEVATQLEQEVVHPTGAAVATADGAPGPPA